MSKKMSDVLLSKFAWWRKLRGGHWEAWLFEQGGGPTWLRMKKCTFSERRPVMPSVGCRGTPTCENHGVAMDLE